MKASVGVFLGLVFVGLATLNVITILESSRPGRTGRKRTRAIAIHRVGGYLFIGLFIVMAWSMCKRLIGSSAEISGTTVLHIALAIALAPLLLAKVVIARRYKNHHAILLPLGLSIYVISFVLVFVGALPYVFALIDPQSAIVKLSIVSLVIFCAYLVRLTLRPAVTQAVASPEPLPGEGPSLTAPSSADRTDLLYQVDC